MPQKKTKTENHSWPPRWLTPVPQSEQDNGDGDVYAKFAEAVCRVTKDSVASPAGKLLILRDWQKELLRHALARREDGRFRHRTALVGMARKNGKSALAASMGLAGLTLGGNGSEIYSCAADRDQARIVFGTAKRMIELDEELSSMFVLYRDAIEFKEKASVYRVLSAEAYTKEGLNPSPLVIFDEVHAQPSWDLWNTLSLAGGARADSLLFGITTAGIKSDSAGQDSLCYSLYQYGQQLVKGEKTDPSFFFAWWEPTAVDADHRSPQVWAEANPGLGDIVDTQDFESAVLRTPEAEFRTKRCNTFVSTTTAWLPQGSWEALTYEGRPQIPGEDVVLAFDGSFSNDSTALIAWYLGGEKPHCSVIGLWEKPDNAEQGWFVPVAEVEAAIISTARNNRITVREIVFDPARWNRTFMVLDESRGVMVAKASARRKVDAAVAAIFGYDRATQPPPPKPPVAQFFSIQV